MFLILITDFWTLNTDVLITEYWILNTMSERRIFVIIYRSILWQTIRKSFSSTATAQCVIPGWKGSLIGIAKRSSNSPHLKVKRPGSYWRRFSRIISGRIQLYITIPGKSTCEVKPPWGLSAIWVFRWVLWKQDYLSQKPSGMQPTKQSPASAISLERDMKAALCPRQNGETASWIK